MVVNNELYLFVSFFNRNRSRQRNTYRKHKNLTDDQVQELKRTIGLEVKDLTYKFIEVDLKSERIAKMYAYKPEKYKNSKLQTPVEYSADKLPSQESDSLERFKDLNLRFDEYQDGTTRAMGVFISRDRLVDLMPSNFAKVYHRDFAQHVYQSGNTGQSSYFAGWINYKRNAKQSPSGIVYYITANNEVAEISPIPRRLAANPEPQFERILFKYEKSDERLSDLCMWSYPRGSSTWLYVLCSDSWIYYFETSKPELTEIIDLNSHSPSGHPASTCCIVSNEQYLVAAECVSEGKTLNNYYTFTRNLKNRKKSKITFSNAIEVDCSNTLISTQNSVHNMLFFKIDSVLYLISNNIFSVCNLFVMNMDKLVFLKKVQVTSTDVLWTLIKRVSQPGLFIVGGSNKLAKDLQVTFDGIAHPPIYSTDQNEETREPDMQNVQEEEVVDD